MFPQERGNHSFSSTHRLMKKIMKWKVWKLWLSTADDLIVSLTTMTGEGTEHEQMLMRDSGREQEQEMTSQEKLSEQTQTNHWSCSVCNEKRNFAVRRQQLLCDWLHYQPLQITFNTCEYQQHAGCIQRVVSWMGCVCVCVYLLPSSSIGWDLQAKPPIGANQGAAFGGGGFLRQMANSLLLVNWLAVTHH